MYNHYYSGIDEESQGFITRWSQRRLERKIQMEIMRSPEIWANRPVGFIWVGEGEDEDEDSACN